MRLALLVTVLLATSAPAANESYASARESYLKLKSDPSKRAFRHHWLFVIKKLEAASRGGSNVAEALYLLGEAHGELFKYSRQADDRAAAERALRRLCEEHPKHRLADDAALTVARALAQRGETAQARRVIEGVLGSANDMRGQLNALLSTLPKEPAKTVKKATPSPAKRSAPTKPSAPPKAVAGTKPEPVKAAPPVARKESGNTRTLSDAIARLARTVRPIQPEAEEPARGRRLAPLRAPPVVELEPPSTGGEDNDEVHEDARAPLVQSLAERLRDVRVGSSQEALDDAKSRLKQVAVSDAELSLAQQLGLKFKRVIIDAGHGGHDTGAIGQKGTREKDVSLKIAKRLARLLEAQGLEVLLTRDDDTYVALEERTRFANSHRGDLFISVHCNAAPNRSLRGVETYTLNTSSNRYAIRLSARENATSERGVGDLQYILADLATKANTGESTRLAELVQSSVVGSLSREWKGVKSLGTKEALFFVLLGAKMPAILVETSFLSNPEEEARLADDAYQGRIAQGIADAVSTFLQARSRVAQID